MGSSAVQHLVKGEKNIHVGFDRDSKMWWAVGVHGSYGGHRSHAQAVKIAQGAANSTHGVVVLHNSKGKVVGSRPAAARGSSQFFQDSVP